MHTGIISETLHHELDRQSMLADDSCGILVGSTWRPVVRDQWPPDSPVEVVFRKNIP